MSFELKYFLCRHISIMRIPKSCLSVCLSVPREKISPYLRQYQSCNSNWYSTGKVSTSSTAWKPKNSIFFSEKIEIKFYLVFWLVLKYWNHPSFVKVYSSNNWNINGLWKDLHESCTNQFCMIRLHEWFFTNQSCMETQKFDFLLRKGRNWILTCVEVLKSP